MVTVTGHQGVPLHVTTYGDQDKPAILLIHGWSQHSSCWDALCETLSDRYYLVAPDLRGHGASGKPEDPAAYDSSAPWAGDVHAMIDQLGLDHPILVGWSMGGWVVQDYVMLHGAEAISGLVLIGTSLTTGDKLPPETAALRRDGIRAPDMYLDDQRANVAATLGFTRACFAKDPGADVIARTVGTSMLVPPAIRWACRMRSVDYRPTTKACNRPIWLVWGSEDQAAVPPMRDEAIQTLPDAQVTLYDGLGHTPFVEDTPAFARDLDAFATRAFAALPSTRQAS